MSGRLWKREQHTRRLISRHLQQHIQPFWGYGEPPEVQAAWPRRRWRELGCFEQWAEAQVVASRHPGSVLEPVWRYCRKPKPHRQVIGYRVGVVTRLGAPYRTPVTTWALEEAAARHQQTQARRWLKRGSLKGGIAASTRSSRRRWRRAGQQICRLALRGDLDTAGALDPQPRRLGVMWDIW
ncbi:hypothetical protein K7W42_05900 [Deinococcus sp. HMF7604]|uniref:hypothetical protein n=1 Tax=Deinococcus betulae TaxID=2873312 RepID=UPI001CCC2977|nr:hypothetical protein [Deinococcus betulae]MBZ9750391.1 hypothetical protein [Deinococcus betulae]